MYIQFCTGVATQAVHISTIIRARSLYFTPIKLTDTRMHCIFRLRATGHHHFGHNTVKYIELCPLLISGSIELNDMAWARELLSAEGDLLLPDNKIWTIIHPAIVEMSAQQVL